MDDYVFRMDRIVRSGGLIESHKRRLETAWSSLGRLMGLVISDLERRLTDADTVAERTTEMMLIKVRQRFLKQAGTLNALSPLGVLERGFAICRKPDGEILRSSSQVSVDGEVDILLHQGELKVRVTNALPGGMRTSKEE